MIRISGPDRRAQRARLPRKLRRSAVVLALAPGCLGLFAPSAGAIVAPSTASTIFGQAGSYEFTVPAGVTDRRR